MSAADPYGSPALPGVVGVFLTAFARARGIHRGVVVLTHREADFLRRVGFPSAATQRVDGLVLCRPAGRGVRVSDRYSSSKVVCGRRPSCRPAGTR